MKQGCRLHVLVQLLGRLKMIATIREEEGFVQCYHSRAYCGALQNDAFTVLDDDRLTSRPSKARDECAPLIALSDVLACICSIQSVSTSAQSSSRPKITCADHLSESREQKHCIPASP